jgi:hypothetical protein
MLFIGRLLWLRLNDKAYSCFEHLENWGGIMQVGKKIADYFKVDKELIIVFLLVAIAGFIFFFVSNQRSFLTMFYIPVLIGAYHFGKRYATNAATLSVILVSVIAYYYPASFVSSSSEGLYRWLDIVTWGGFLLVIGYYMGLLYEKKERANEEIRTTYQGIIEMLSLLIDSVDKQTQSHSYRVSVVAERIAIRMRCPQQEIENIKIAALLHDLGKLGLSAEVLNKIGKLSAEEREHVETHTKIGAELLAPVGGRVLDILPYILLHHEKYDGTGYQNVIGEGIPLGARIIAVADYYDALLSDRPYRQGLSPLTVRNEILQNSGRHFDPDVVEAFADIFQTLGADMPLISENLLRKNP